MGIRNTELDMLIGNETQVTSGKVNVNFHLHMLFSLVPLLEQSQYNNTLCHLAELSST